MLDEDVGGGNDQRHGGDAGDKGFHARVRFDKVAETCRPRALAPGL